MKIFETKHTLGDFIRAVLAIDNEADAKEFVEEYVQWLKNHHVCATRKIMRSNIGWCFGEGLTDERMQMWHKVCGAVHPVFGMARPTFDEALQMGMKIAKSWSMTNYGQRL